MRRFILAGSPEPRKRAGGPRAGPERYRTELWCPHGDFVRAEGDFWSPASRFWMLFYVPLCFCFFGVDGVTRVFDVPTHREGCWTSMKKYTGSKNNALVLSTNDRAAANDHQPSVGASAPR